MGAVVPPIFQTSLFLFDTWDEFYAAKETQYDASPEGKCFYSRINNPTLDLVGERVAALEHTERARLFTSGMSAISAARSDLGSVACMWWSYE